jgi:hypothetical protein
MKNLYRFDLPYFDTRGLSPEHYSLYVYAHRQPTKDMLLSILQEENMKGLRKASKGKPWDGVTLSVLDSLKSSEVFPILEEGEILKNLPFMLEDIEWTIGVELIIPHEV